MKKSIFIVITSILALLLLLSLSANFYFIHEKNNEAKDKTWTEELLTDIKNPSEYGEDVDELLHDSLTYFSYVQDAYDNSDKVKLNSFQLSEDYQIYLEKVQNADTSYSLSDDASMTRSLMKMMLMEPVLKMEVKLKERDLIIFMDEDVTNEDWFLEMQEILLEAKDFYTNKEYLSID